MRLAWPRQWSKPAQLSVSLVIGAEKTSSVLDWVNRNVAVLFGDGAAALVVEGIRYSARFVGRVVRLLCRGARFAVLFKITVALLLTTHYAKPPRGISMGRDIFKRAVAGMVGASNQVLDEMGLSCCRYRSSSFRIRLIAVLLMRWGESLAFRLIEFL